MPSKLSKWGNSLGVRVPSHIAERAGLQCGDQLYIRLLDSGDILVRAARPGAGPPGYAVPNGSAPIPEAKTSDDGSWDVW